ncbi:MULTISPECIES: transcription/translation regulatory transformer protein RfaH [Tatumella]|uniref:Transcription antitermination protein RfaH n=1 Tax=Tatumella punctata TaxID=399969 RepID=A0ABW1VQP0_9GAMM|nr:MULTISPECIES: transcription/translation regulatory transformer protein RfaH [unclassified Tatumella]MBS0857142.1 transcription/translation regulatory transformer protein RfaH [Tatumella sp. JGM16]MBS0878509.1 transcription/translation regulatory transformer protein RfaH [Tatumella sp. JGM82]MBS0892101.1 transcription/translation regulatory transformer protein RfaH [Tatumella sp. JGM94]MBS0894044.1 transcription/translation regulatory transformer protein RfaH [Tatumella sp. JGM130]MBS0903200
MESWYLLFCKRGQLLRAQEHLERQGVACLSPVTEVEKKVRGKLSMVSEPLFPNYLFIRFSPEVIHTTTINATRGVSHFVRFGALPATVPEEVIDSIINKDYQCLQAGERPRQGDEVEIIAGTFEGLRAIFTEPEGETRSLLLLNLLNKQVVRSIGNQQFRKVWPD